jgi:acetyl-CoA synthetase
MSDRYEFGGPIVWRPTSDYIENAHLTKFMRLHQIPDFTELMRLSTLDVAWFSEAVLEYLDIRFYRPYTEVVNLSQGIALPQWCVNGEMNIVHNCLDKYIGTEVEHRLAMISETEDGQSCTFTYGQLWREVNKTANALRSLGLGKGDPIGLFFPMACEIVIALLAVAKIGGVILPLFSGFGAGAIAARLNDAGAKALITADGAYRRGKIVNMKQIADEAAGDIPTLEHMIVLRRTELEPKLEPGRDVWWHEIVDRQDEVCETERTSAEDQLMIIYTSGTTGKPKGAVHTHCGFPVKAAQDMAFGTDIHPGDVIYWMTDMGWMMGPWLVFGGLILGGTIFLYDGAPDFPGPDRIWDMVERYRITTLGVSPTLIRSLIPHGEEPFRKHDLSSLKFFASTGEPWNPDPWMWLFERVGEGKRPIINYSGGTEISGGIVMCNPILPLKACSFSGPCPGIAADVVDDEGVPVREKVGELVIRAPWIGMTRGFWKDTERYLETYWSHWPDIWQHGDFAMIDADGQWYILGRSDDTIKVAGKRIGPAEVESILVSHQDVVEAAAIGVPHPVKGSEVIVFCVLAPGVQPGEEIRRELIGLVASALGKPLAPKEVRFVRDLPKTRNAKVMRRIIRAAYLGEDPGDTSSLVNPETVNEISGLR